ncbi:T-cell surface glycoprotein CD3 zeta chain [Dissostichus eleginoides]|uniref:T-cell surface glycoprotein CD3 zeta chain n=1 Tax=Dissostichus eleginoides TaxID=100907 RepID=A0AAD9EP55_DISEL|nr:T-cell surface glycoprotein CD3 zeta chain [Dissostichus eleginoides]
MRIYFLLLLLSRCPPAGAVNFHDPQLCYVLDGFLGLYGLFITGMFVKEKFFKGKLKEESLYSDLKDSERGRGRSTGEELYTGLTRPTDGEYKELPLKGLSSGSRDTYDSLQMQPLTR